MPAYELILYHADHDSGIARITLNRPDRLNALNDQMQIEIADAVAEADADPNIRVLIITGSGRAFCAGGDLNNLGGSANGSGAGWTSGNADEVRRSFRLAQEMILGVQRCEKPVIAMVNGVATGAGLDLACACDIRIGAPRSRFMSAYVRIGLFPGFGGTWLYPRTIGSLGRAAEMLFTGDFLEADEAYRLGFLNRLVSEERFGIDNDGNGRTHRRRPAHRHPPFQADALQGPGIRPGNGHENGRRRRDHHPDLPGSR